MNFDFYLAILYEPNRTLIGLDKIKKKIVIKISEIKLSSKRQPCTFNTLSVKHCSFGLFDVKSVSIGEKLWMLEDSLNTKNCMFHNQDIIVLRIKQFTTYC